MGEQLQGFFESTAGVVTTIVVIVVLLLLIMRGGSKDTKKTDIKALTVSALMIALSTILGNVKIFEMPQGGSVTLLSILPIVFVAYLYGTRRGVIAGFCVGLLNLIFGPYIIHPIQLLMDYPIPYGALGLAGLCRNSKLGLTKGFIVGVIARGICHTLSGVIFFASYAPEGMNPWVYSAGYNFSFLAVEAVITLIIINIPPVRKALENIKNSVVNS
ncbi:MAG: energy-coupled thiamine transporter ThiT [Mogibacterium sp.]|nr:energy-coupled thiamine transporter ThiT [Mogibacterium sp.]